MSRSLRYLPIALGICLLTTAVEANNILVANVGMSANPDATAQIQFDLSWENSWKGGPTANWDAAWVFVKVRSATTGVWSHAHLSSSGHVAPPDVLITPGQLTPFLPPDPWTPIPHAGAFIHRESDGSGNVSFLDIELRWDHGNQGIALTDVAEVRVFAIEMVYVTTGDFAAGGVGAEGGFALTTINTGLADVPPSGIGSLGGQAGGHPTGETAPVSNWPNGFNAFYCMKYEVSQQGFVDLLNTLTFEQQYLPDAPAGTTVLANASGWRNGMVVLQPGAAGASPATYACDLNGNGIEGEADDGADLPCVGMHFNDLAAYLDWAALRPMTELEFEKTCRGPMPPLENEYPWGSSTLTNAAYGLANEATANEGIAAGYSTLQGNAAWSATTDAVGFPLRVGIFAANPALNGRSAAGASYYGAMELAGNVAEYCVSLSDIEGASYTGEHGDGLLDPVGDSNANGWPYGYISFAYMSKGGHGESSVAISALPHATYPFSFSRPWADVVCERPEDQHQQQHAGSWFSASLRSSPTSHGVEPLSHRCREVLVAGMRRAEAR